MSLYSTLSARIQLDSVMFGIRTPVKKGMDASPGAENAEATKVGPAQTSNVRRSIGEWETGKGVTRTSPTKSPINLPPGAPAKAKSRTVQPTAETRALTRKTSTEAQMQSPPVQKPKYVSRTAEAKANLVKAKTLLGQSRNLKADIKTDVTMAIERLYELVKEGEQNKRVLETTVLAEPVVGTGKEDQLAGVLREHMKTIKEHTERMKDLEKALEMQKKEYTEGKVPLSYAEVAASQNNLNLPLKTTIHSVVVTSKEETESGEEVLNRIRRAVDAKEGWVRVESVRKAKDRKVILGFTSREERNKARQRLERDGVHLLVEEVKNRDPLLKLRDVLSMNTNEDIIKAFRNQNKEVFHGLDEEEDRIAIKYRKKARNPHVCHVVMSVSPAIGGKTLKAGSLHIDLQRIRVEDQSPLIQCTRCLGFGHGKRFCKEPADLCSHCGGPHLNQDCAERLAGEKPSCRNCTKAHLEKTDHSAFHRDCPMRHKWDKLARSMVAYC